MSGLTNLEKKQLKAAKQKLIGAVASAMKLPQLTPDESALLETVLGQAIHDRIGQFTIRHSEIMQGLYIVYGILYNHMDDRTNSDSQPPLFQQGSYTTDNVPF